MKERELQLNNHIVRKDKNMLTFVNDNKEICMKNYLLNLLENERTTINENGLLVNKALFDSKMKLQKDEKNFEDFTEKEKRLNRYRESKLQELGNENRNLQNTKKKLMYEHKQIIDDLDRTIKIITNFKGNASFVHTVLEDYSIKFKINDNILDSRTDFMEAQSKEKDIQKLTEQIL
jgi:hypothetical protein